jgi:phage terminase large subunit
MSFTFTTAIQKIQNITERKKIIQGGSSAGKTFAILAILIDRCIKEKNLSVSVVAESMPHLRRGALRDFLNIMKGTNRYFDDHYNRTNLIYTFSNGSYMEFFAAENSDKLKGSRRDCLLINECNHVTYDAYLQLSIRTRGDIYLDYNPTNRFWVHNELLQEEDARMIILNYKDNEALDDNTVNQFAINKKKANTSEYWRNWCKVYIDGEVGSLDGVIFDNWKEISNLPEEARLIGYGLDFGYSNDPSSLIGVYKFNEDYILDEVVYRTGLTNNQLHSLFAQEGVEKSAEIWADSAEPKSIKELTNYGWRVRPTSKGRDSIMYGIGLMQQHNLLVTSKSINLITELQNYQWKKNRNDETQNVPIDIYNHAIDAIRYLFMSKLGKKNSNAVPFFMGK